MTPDPMPEPEGPDDERFVYAVTAAGAEAVRQSVAAFDSARPMPHVADGIALDTSRSDVRY